MSEQILTAQQMRTAEAELIAAGTSVEALMRLAGQGAAGFVWRMAGPGRMVTVLTGAGNNGGDGWVLAEAIRQRGGRVQVVMAAEPRTPAAISARAAYGGAVVAGAGASGAVLVDCLFGTGLTRPLEAGDLALLQGLAARHGACVAVDLPSGIEADSGAALNEGLPDYQLTIALGAWKFAHYLMPAAARMGGLRLVEIGVAPVAGAAQVLARPGLAAPAADAHKYRRGLVGVVLGAMPGAAVLAGRAAQGAGAGYVKLLGDGPLAVAVPADLVVAPRDLAEPRLGALLVGPGLGRDGEARARLAEALGAGHRLVLDADALHLLRRGDALPEGAIATPHEGELAAMERAFGLSGAGAKWQRAQALAQASGLVILAKGPDSLIAAPDGRLLCAARAPSWLSVAGSGDVLAGCVAARLAAGEDAFAAAATALWLHGEAARLAGGPFTAGQLAGMVRAAYRTAL